MVSTISTFRLWGSRSLSNLLNRGFTRFKAFFVAAKTDLYLVKLWEKKFCAILTWKVRIPNAVSISFLHSSTNFKRKIKTSRRYTSQSLIATMTTKCEGKPFARLSFFNRLWWLTPSKTKSSFLQASVFVVESSYAFFTLLPHFW